MISQVKQPCDEAAIHGAPESDVADKSSAAGKWVLAATILASSMTGYNPHRRVIFTLAYLMQY